MLIGKTVKQAKGFSAFIPAQFPPVSKFDLPADTEKLHADAAFLLGKLDGITQLLPDLDFFIFMYVRKEAALSSEIEGTQATMIDSIQADAETSTDLPKDVERILHYIDAMNYGLKRLESLPLSLRLIKEVHKTLIEGTADAIGRTPGGFRKSQNWIGGTKPENAKYVPPPVHEMTNALDDLEKFMHSKDKIPPLIKTALLHAQFETIHPFLDGNGRAGRLLITFYLCQQKILERPAFYLSEYFKRHRELYFDLLHRYHDKNEIIPWINFFLEGVATVAEEAINVAKNINDLRNKHLEKIQSLGRRAEVGIKLFKNLYKLPIMNVKKVEEWTGLSRPSANSLVKEFVKMGILKQRDATKTYGRVFEYENYLELF